MAEQAPPTQVSLLVTQNTESVCTVYRYTWTSQNNNVIR